MGAFSSYVFSSWAFSSSVFTGTAAPVAVGVPSVARVGGGARIQERAVFYPWVKFCAPDDIKCLFPEVDAVVKKKTPHPLENLPKKKDAAKRFDDKVEINRLRGKIRDLEDKLKASEQRTPEADPGLLEEITRLKDEVASLRSLLEKERSRPPRVVMAEPSYQEVSIAKLPEVNFLRAVPRISKAVALFASSYLLPSGLSRSVMQAESIGLLINGIMDAILPIESPHAPIDD